MDSSQKLVWRCYQLLSQFLVNVDLPRVSGQSHLSDDEIKPGLSTDLPNIYLTAEDNPEKIRLGDLGMTIYYSHQILTYSFQGCRFYLQEDMSPIYPHPGKF